MKGLFSFYCHRKGFIFKERFITPLHSRVQHPRVFSSTMCDYVLPTYLPLNIPTITRFTLAKPSALLISNHRYSSGTRSTNGCLQFVTARFQSFVLRVSSPTSTNSRSSGSEEHELFGELEFKQQKPEIQFEEQMLKSDSRGGGAFSSPEGFPAYAIDDDLVKVSDGSESDGSQGLKIKESEEKRNLRRGRQLIRRSNLIAKQVISLHTALSLGFVSQLWVDTNSWGVLIVEVRPSLLSGEFERFLLDDITQVGDVVLIEDENVTENEYKMVGLDTLVGYNVVTPGRRNIGKVRGFTFNINSGAVESLELDSFGISIIPSSLVSTYALFVEDVLEVISDTVVVHEAAASRIQRLTKGLWDDQKNVGGNSIDELEEYETEPAESDYGRQRKRRSGRRKSSSKIRDIPDEWELPMDYL